MRVSGLRYRTKSFLKIRNQQGILSAVSYLSNQVVVDFFRTVHRIYVNLRTEDGLYLKDVDVGRMYLSVNDPGISRQLAKNKSRESGLVELIREEIELGMVGDVG